MISTQSIRRPMLALIAGSALLLGGAAMPKFCLQNPTMLYVLGEARMAVGDHDGGLQMIGNATQEKDKAPEMKPAATPAKKTPVEVCTKTQVHIAKTPVTVSYRKFEMPSADQYMQLARLEQVNFASPSFDEARFEAKMQHAVAQREAEHVRRTMSHVRVELERRGIAVPPAIPQAPMAVALTQ